VRGRRVELFSGLVPAATIKNRAAEIGRFTDR
ncbi:MAG: hypothetical protein ACI9BK_003252, partial [Acidimicrobiales bacterium]